MKGGMAVAVYSLDNPQSILVHAVDLIKWGEGGTPPHFKYMVLA